ncbi:MAG: hypothetical protein ACRD2W_17860 [Acidimicrobiales bacterium]
MPLLTEQDSPSVRQTAAGLLPVVLIVLALVLIAWSLAWLP